MANFLPILTYGASIQLNLFYWTWIWPQKLKNVIFLFFQKSYISKSRNYKMCKKTCHSLILRLNSSSVTKIKLNWCPIRQNWQKFSISRQYPEFPKTPLWFFWPKFLSFDYRSKKLVVLFWARPPRVILMFQIGVYSQLRKMWQKISAISLQINVPFLPSKPPLELSMKSINTFFTSCGNFR